jgi:hypothetical protein
MPRGASTPRSTATADAPRQAGRAAARLCCGTADAGRCHLAALIERVRILCTVYDADTGEYRYDWKLILEIIGGLGFFALAMIWFYLGREWRSQRRRRPPAWRGARSARGIGRPGERRPTPPA